jgi:predicted peroxiredoxin
MNQQNETGTYFYTLSSTQDPDRIAVPLVLANAALSMGQEAYLWLTLDGVKVGKKGAMDDMVSPSFAAIKDLLNKFQEAGGRMGICPACAGTHGVTDDNMVDNAEWMGAAAVQEAALGRHIMTF